MTHCTLLLVLLLGGAASLAADKPTLQTLREKADASKGQDCADVCLEAAQAFLEDSNNKFTEGAVDAAHQSMKDAVEYARKAAEASLTAKKRQKKTEIGLRKLSRRMTDIRQTLAVDDRPAVDEGIKVIEKLRTDLLMSMFDEK